MPAGRDPKQGGCQAITPPGLHPMTVSTRPPISLARSFFAGFARCRGGRLAAGVEPSTLAWRYGGGALRLVPCLVPASRFVADRAADHITHAELFAVDRLARF